MNEMKPEVMRAASGGRLPALFTALVWLAVAPGQRASSLDWPSWRGPDANGSTATGKYPTRWDATTVLWKAVLPGKGSSTPIALDRRIYVTAPTDVQDTLLTFDLDGAALWQTKLGT